MSSDPYRTKNDGMKGRLVCFLTGILLLAGLSAQDITETNWYFGDSSFGLAFDLNGRDSYLLSDQGSPLGTAGSAVITDQFSGNVLFYSDGQYVYDGAHNQLTSGLLGNPAVNVPVATAPVTGSDGQFYLFTNSGNSGLNEIRYSIADANLVGNGTAAFPLGLMISINNGTGLTNPSEGMIVIPAGNGSIFWLITQDRTTFDYRVTRLGSGGLEATNTFNFTASAPGAEIAHFSYNVDSSFLAVAPKTANRNVRILNFDPSTGNLSFERQILQTGYNDGQGESVYDLEWSADGSKLYLSRFGSGATAGNLYQYDLGDSLNLINSILTAPIFRSYGLQRGIDGRIYHLHQLSNGSAYRIGRINQPDSLATNAMYESMAFTEDFNGTQFPNFTGSYAFGYTTLDFTYLDSCQNNSTKFFPLVDPVPQHYSWDFTGGSGSNDIAPIITFQNPGDYDIRLTVTTGGYSTSVLKTVTIHPSTFQVDLGNDTTICVDEILFLDAGDGGVSYLWSTGAQQQTVAIDTAGTYWVEVIGPDGCPAYDEIEVTEYGVVKTVNNQWYFGENAGIDFTEGASAITDENVMYSPEGCASISDIDGNLLFYTNGQTIWNRAHEVMANGDSIGGDSTALQAAIIMPFPDESTMYYVFTSEEVYGASGVFQNKVAIVDMKQDSARGRVMVKNIFLNNYGTEKLNTTTLAGAGWLLSHELGTNIYRTNLIHDLGIGPTIYSLAGEELESNDELQGTGALKFSNGSQFIANALPRSSGSFLEILDFDAGTGVVSNQRLIDIQEPDPVYGLEFSQDGSKVYLTTNSATSKLIQYDLDSIFADDAAADIAASKYDGYATGANYGALQMGPDGTIYMAVDNSTTIGTISSPSGNDDGASFDPAGFDLLTRTSRLGLPNFGQENSTTTSGPAIIIDVGCYGEASRFSAVGRDDSIEEYSWLFGDGTFAIGQDTTHVYALPGTYTVQLTLFNRCDVDTVLYENIIISQNTEMPQVPLDTTICDQPIILSAWPVDRAGYTYNWSTGETTRQIVVSQPAIVTVSISDPNGCESETAFSFVADGRPEVEIGSGAVYCVGDSPPALDAGNSGATYEWQVDAVSVGNTMTQAINTTVAGTYRYTVAITDPLTMCVGRDTLNVTILDVPDVTVTPTPTDDCGNSNGQLDIAFNESGNFDYEIQGPGFFTAGNTDGPSVNQSGLEPGNYTVEVTSTVTGCTNTIVSQIEDPVTFGLALASTGNCEGQVQIDLLNVPADFNYEILDSLGNMVSSGSNLSSFTGLDPGTYSVSVTDNNPLFCTETEEINIPAGDEPDISFDAQQSVCGTEGDVFIFDGTFGAGSFAWTGPGIVGLTNGNTITVNQAGTYIVTVSQAGLCDRTESIQVTLYPEHNVTAEMTGEPCDGEIVLSAAITGGSGDFTYLWSSGQLTQQFTATTSGSYFVTVRDRETTCEITSDAVDVVIEELIEASISATPDCENNGRIILDAVTQNEGVSYRWTGPSGPLNSTASQIFASEAGLYEVTVTGSSGNCSITAQFEAILDPITEDDLLLDDVTNFCSLDASNPGVLLDPGVFNTYEWTKVPSPTILSTDPTIYVTESGTYEVTLYNGFTCTTDRIKVLDDCKPVIFAPNAFTPNQDGLNDSFSVIPNPNVQDFRIVIANRWGEPVFVSEDQNFAWDGTLEGKLLPPGTYSYRMTFKSTVDSSVGFQDQYGAVLLLR